MADSERTAENRDAAAHVAVDNFDDKPHPLMSRCLEPGCRAWCWLGDDHCPRHRGQHAPVRQLADLRLSILTALDEGRAEYINCTYSYCSGEAGHLANAIERLIASLYSPDAPVPAPARELTESDWHQVADAGDRADERFRPACTDRTVAARRACSGRGSVSPKWDAAVRREAASLRAGTQPASMPAEPPTQLADILPRLPSVAEVEALEPVEVAPEVEARAVRAVLEGRRVGKEPAQGAAALLLLARFYNSHQADSDDGCRCDDCRAYQRLATEDAAAALAKRVREAEETAGFNRMVARSAIDALRAAFAHIASKAGITGASFDGNGSPEWPAVLRDVWQVGELARSVEGEAVLVLAAPPGGEVKSGGALGDLPPVTKGQRFAVGHIVRYGPGSTALMRVEMVSAQHGGSGPRYFGRQYFGGSVGAYERDCTAATPEERQRYLDHEDRIARHGGKESGNG